MRRARADEELALRVHGGGPVSEARHALGERAPKIRQRSGGAVRTERDGVLPRGADVRRRDARVADVEANEIATGGRDRVDAGLEVGEDSGPHGAHRAGERARHASAFPSAAGGRAHARPRAPAVASTTSVTT